ncbi:hypothetical protein WJX74_008372 [Apatococcus lobatus]|uniref:Uncharacterized protein n=1 Tax=Apatococcus lobatus TaxID=904363 RepID=A0AAW1Q874_9CHLO
MANVPVRVQRMLAFISTIDRIECLMPGNEKQLATVMRAWGLPREDASTAKMKVEPGAQELQATSLLLTKPASNQQSRKQPQYEADLLSVWLSESKSSHKPSNSIDAPVSSVPRNIHIPHSSQDPCDLDHRKVAQCPRGHTKATIGANPSSKKVATAAAAAL